MYQVTRRADYRIDRSLAAGTSTGWMNSSTGRKPLKPNNYSSPPLLRQVLWDEALMPLFNERLDSFSQFY